VRAVNEPQAPNDYILFHTLTSPLVLQYINKCCRDEDAQMAKYGKSVGKDVEKEMHAYKKGKAHSGKAKKPVKSKKQAIAIALSKARKKGKKVPKKKNK